jgi:hypothetical protein
MGSDAPVTAARRAHFTKGALLGLVLNERAILADPPAEWPIAV